MFLVVGLGNPGKEYQNNRHNIGFRVIQTVANSLGNGREGTECNAIVSKVEKDDTKIILAQPLTFVNASGRSVQDLASKYELFTQDIIVIHDDLDLPLGDVRVKANGGSGGHNGVESIIYQIGSEDFNRVRIGIGRPPGRKDPAGFVLSDFTEKEEQEISVAVEEAADAVLEIIEKGLSSAMNRYNQKESE